jgi:hypothetical protein
MVLVATLVICVMMPLLATAQSAMPSIKTVEPTTAKVGDTVKAAGENLDKKSVSQMFLTDGKNDVQCQMSEQTPTSITFKVPAGAKPMRYSLAVLTTGKDQKFIEQPVKLEVK